MLISAKVPVLHKELTWVVKENNKWINLMLLNGTIFLQKYKIWNVLPLLTLIKVQIQQE